MYNAARTHWSCSRKRATILNLLGVLDVLINSAFSSSHFFPISVNNTLPSCTNNTHTHVNTKKPFFLRMCVHYRKRIKNVWVVVQVQWKCGYRYWCLVICHDDCLFVVFFKWRLGLSYLLLLFPCCGNNGRWSKRKLRAFTHMSINATTVNRLQIVQNVSSVSFHCFGNDIVWTCGSVMLSASSSVSTFDVWYHMFSFLIHSVLAVVVL